MYGSEWIVVSLDALSTGNASTRTTGLEVTDGAVPQQRIRAVLTNLSSDAHTWNLVYLQLLLKELGCQVTNLGACTPDWMIISECAARRPDLVVISSVNGHGCQDGIRLIGAFRAYDALAATRVVIGGKLDVVGGSGGDNETRLLAAGFDAVFDGATGLAPFRSFVGALTAAEPPIGPE